MSDGFYSAFEEKYRGSRELIKSRLRVYLPFIEPLKTLCTDPTALDLGCGRGEWLELLKESGFDGHGVDLDDGMLAACRELGLNVTTADAIAALKALPDESQTVVSGFHIAEHLPFSVLQVLVQEALRVLKPAGLLILETPNPENIVVGTASFYQDPTHQCPIPLELLSFLPEYYGFGRVKILRLQESVALSDDRALTLKDVLGGVSPDYAVVAQKAADDSILAATGQAFGFEYGISLETLADRYDRQAETMAHAAESRALQAETTAHAAESRALRAETTAHAAESRALRAETTAHAAESRALQAETTAHAAATRALQAATRALQAETMTQAAKARAQQAETMAQAAKARAQQAETMAQAADESRLRQVETIEYATETSVLQARALHAVYNSRSWRMTAPLRWCGLQARRLRQQGFTARTQALFKKIARPIVRRGIAFVNARPGLRIRCASLARKLGLYETARALYVRLTSRGKGTASHVIVPQAFAHGEMSMHLPPRARRIYADLKAATEKSKEIH